MSQTVLFLTFLLKNYFMFTFVNFDITEGLVAGYLHFQVFAIVKKLLCCIKNLSNEISYLQIITNGVDFLDCFKNRFGKIIVERVV